MNNNTNRMPRTAEQIIMALQIEILVERAKDRAYFEARARARQRRAARAHRKAVGR